MKKILIVGGVTGGASAAARLRRLNEEDEIILFERSEHTSCAGCGLPYYIGGVIEERRKLLQTVSGLAKRYRLDIRCGSEVLSINRDDKSITVREKETGETYEESYDKLVLSTGSRPSVPDLPGMDEAENAFTLKDVQDADVLKKALMTLTPKHAVVLGGGFGGFVWA